MDTNSKITINDCWNRIGVWSNIHNFKDRCPELIKIAHCRNCPVYSQAGRQLLNRPITEDYQEELIETYQKKRTPVDDKTKSAFVFMAGGEWLALHSYLISEVVNIAPIHSIPHKNNRIFRGLVNVRGRLELCVSLGGLLRIENRYRKVRGIPTIERLIVAIKDDQSVVFPVTEVMGPVKYNPSMITPMPITVSGSRAVYIKGILTAKGKDVGFLDDDMLFKILTRNIS